MENKVFEKQDIQLMKYFVDDESTKYDEALLAEFLTQKNAFGYVLVKPDGRRRFLFARNKVVIIERIYIHLEDSVNLFKIFYNEFTEDITLKDKTEN